MTQEEKDFLRTYDIAKYPRPSVAVDVVLFTLASNNEDMQKVNVGPLQILLIQRASYPEKGKWCLPGVFCRQGEKIEDAARRALYEETGITDSYLKLNNIYSRPDRDPRGWILSTAFLGTCNKNQCVLRSGENAWKALWFDLNVTETVTQEARTKYNLTLHNKKENIKLIIQAQETAIPSAFRVKREREIVCSELGFDHGEIVTNAVLSLRKGAESDKRLVFELLPEYFTIGALQAAYSRIFGITEAIPNFRRNMEKYVIATDEWEKGRHYRPSRLYKRNLDMF